MRFLNLLFGRTVDSVIADIISKVNLLQDIAFEQHDAAAYHEEKAEEHEAKAAAAVLEHKRAMRLAEKFEALIQ